MKSEMKGEMENIFSTLVTAKEDTKLDLAKVHMSIALQLMQGGVGDVNAVNTDSISNLLLTSPQPTTMRSPETTAVTTTTVTPTTEDPSTLDVNRLFRMKAKHSSLTNVLKEWYGLDEFADELGGIQGRIDLFKSTSNWRKKSMIHPQHFSRTMRTVKAVEEFAKVGEIAQQLDKASSNLEEASNELAVFGQQVLEASQEQRAASEASREAATASKETTDALKPLPNAFNEASSGLSMAGTSLRQGADSAAASYERLVELQRLWFQGTQTGLSALRDRVQEIISSYGSQIEGQTQALMKQWTTRAWKMLMARRLGNELLSHIFAKMLKKNPFPNQNSQVWRLGLKSQSRGIKD
jgi:DnaJ-domain-containing protein 1